jgi:trehalose 6-phosphate phosphatase
MSEPTSSAPAGVEPETVERCLATLRRAPAGLVTDIDGTISAIAPTPAEAVVEETARRALRRLAERLALVAVMSGRAAAVGAAMVEVPELIYVGNHGMERSHRGAAWTHPGAAAGAGALAAALAEVASAAQEIGRDEGVIVEDKGLSGTVHYRLAPDPEAARAFLLPLAVAAANRHGLVVTEGRLIVELRPNVVVNKGTAVVDLVAEHRLRGIVFLGDDLTDVDAFVALRTLREAGEVAALRVGVLGAETPPRVREEIDVAVRGVPACVALLAAVAEGLAAEAVGSAPAPG